MASFKCTNALVLACLLSTLGACSSSNTAKPASAGSSAARLRIDQRLDARENLERMASKEAANDRVAFVEVPAPPGVEPSVLARKDPSDPKTRLSMREALDRIIDNAPALLPKPTTQHEIDDDTHAEALKRYVHGRDAALDGRYLVAVTELQKALELEPDSVEVLRE